MAAVNREALRQQRELATTVGETADDTVRQLTELWLREWEALAANWQAAELAVAEQVAATGRWPSAWEQARNVALAAAVLATQQTLVGLVIETARIIAAGAATVVAATLAGMPLLIAAQFPARHRAGVVSRVAGRISPTALDAIVARVSEQITSVTWPLSDETTEAMRRALVVGVAVGRSPRDTGRAMVQAVEGVVNGGLSRAINIARTEQMDAYRTATRWVDEANADVLDGWIWWCACTVRSCPACWAMHGTVHPIEEPGPLGHQSCRCVRLPKLKPWRELGINLNGPNVQQPTGRERFDNLSDAAQLAVMGPARLTLLRSGRIGWADLAVRRDSPGWRPSYTVRTVRDLQHLATLKEM